MQEDNRPWITVDQYRPRAMVRLKETPVLRAKYPAIDAHNHFRDSMDPAKVVADMDECNVRTYIDLSGFNGDRLKRRLDLLKVRLAPAREEVQRSGRDEHDEEEDRGSEVHDEEVASG